MAVRTILSTLNGLTQAGLLAAGWRGRAHGAGRPAGPAVRTAPAPAEWWDGPYARGGIEPPLDELLGDPVVQRVMRADRWDPAEVRRLLRSRQRLVA